MDLVKVTHALETFFQHPTMLTVWSVPRNVTFYNGLDFQLLPICQVVYKAAKMIKDVGKDSGQRWAKCIHFLTVSHL